MNQQPSSPEQAPATPNRKIPRKLIAFTLAAAAAAGGSLIPKMLNGSDSSTQTTERVTAVTKTKTMPPLKAEATNSAVVNEAVPPAPIPTVEVSSPTTASTMEVRRDLSEQEKVAYGNKLISDARARQYPLATAECGRVLYFGQAGQEVRIDNAISIINSDRVQKPGTDAPDNAKSFIRFTEVKDNKTGAVKMNPDGTPEYVSEVFQNPSRVEVLPHASSKICKVAIEKLGDYGNRPVGRIISDNPSANNLRIEVGGKVLAPPVETAPNTPDPEIGHGIPPEQQDPAVGHGVPPESQPAPGQ